MNQLERQIGGVWVRVNFATNQEPMAEEVLAVLAAIDPADRLHPGLRVQFGWSTLTLEEDGPGKLIVCEPDFAGEPLRAVRPRIDTTLAVAERQAALVKHLKVTPEDVNFAQFVVARRHALLSRDLQLFRSPASAPDDSGWSLTSAGSPPFEDEETAFDGLRVYELLARRPAVLPALVLPFGFAAMFEADNLIAVFDAEGRELLQGSLWVPNRP